MNCIRILVLLLATGLVALHSVPAIAQFDIDPDHFDRVGRVKANGDAVMNQISRKTSDAKHKQKRSQPANKHLEGTRQVKAGNQLLLERSKGE